MTLRTLYRREVPEDWVRLLAESYPPTDRWSWLRLRWEPGDPWDTPVDRFLIDQMVPEHAIEPEILEQLADYPSPRDMGNHYDSVKGQFICDPNCLITQTAWLIFQETRCWARPFWVIQGNTGGHKRWFSNVEKKFLKLAGLPMEPPVPGALAYAPFDERVLAQLRKHDMLLADQSVLRRKKSILGGVQDERYEQEERRFRETVVRWLAEQVTEVADGVMESLMALDAPRADFDVKEMERQSEQATENFLVHGRTLGGLAVK